MTKIRLLSISLVISQLTLLLANLIPIGNTVEIHPNMSTLSKRTILSKDDLIKVDSLALFLKTLLLYS